MTTVDEAVAIIQRGGVVAAATDTVYGLFCDPRNPVAVERVYTIKARAPELELNLLAADRAMFEELVEFNDPARRLAQEFWPGALSIVLPAGRIRLAIPRHGATLMVRVPDHQLLRWLLRATGPLASTSANLHGQPAATSAAEVEQHLGGDVDAIIDGGSGAGTASTIIDCSAQPPRVLREGSISPAELRAFIGSR